MIRSESDYLAGVGRIRHAQAAVDAQRAQLVDFGLKPDEIARALEPAEGFVALLTAEVTAYERCLRGEFAPLENLVGLGEMLVGLRISRGVTQRDLAERLGVHESQVSRDECSDYRGVTVERAGKVLAALGVRLKSEVVGKSGRTLKT